ncbi:MAG: disulfide oxidoreductase [Anaerolineae bacterium]|nr:disulfide oxidoreductase [Anaerolineae bacterium]
MRSERTLELVEEYAPALAFLVALVATLGSLYYSEVRGFIPCTLCWYQRILMYPLVAILLAGLIRRDPGLAAYVVPLALLGILVSGYHYTLQLGLWSSESAACRVGVPCSGRYVNWLGFITIPFQALTAFILITVLMIGARAASRRLDVIAAIEP